MEYKFESTEELLEFLNEELLSAAEAIEILDISKVRLGKLVKDGKLIAVKEQPKMFLKSMILEKKEELELLRKKYRPYDE
ncbi:DNA-binding protein [Lysinibacillus sp. AR18-8]|uniref:DNA-binding protein n=1 Tax=Lysinibacillus TaxID=400634 RepID=UPI0008248E34|nr:MULTISPECIES: DNA-binding protein [Lysinibacillus]OCX63579.1 DNA-binding protein [Lysinibacillus sp. AR18-8]WNN77602.1 DNA-binding protein [Lysinibacillus capsici]